MCAYTEKPGGIASETTHIRRRVMKFKCRVIPFILCALVVCAGSVFSAEKHRYPYDPNYGKDAPFRVDANLLDTDETDTWGLPGAPGAETFNVFLASEDTPKFVNHPQIIAFKGKLYCTWQTTPTHEDSTDSIAVYSYSEDGVEWVDPIVIGPDPEGELFRASVGWYVHDDVLMNLTLLRDSGVPGEIKKTEYRTSTDGINWSDIEVMIPDAMGADSLKVYQDRRVIFLGHGPTEDGKSLKFKVYYTDQLDALGGWKQGTMPIETYNNHGRIVGHASEPDWFVRPDGTMVMVMRSPKPNMWEGGNYALGSISTDGGENWTMAVPTNMPDSTNMQCAGNLPDGKCFMVNTLGRPVQNQWLQPRTPLVLWLSDDGKLFDEAYLVRCSPPPRRYDGKSKTPGYSYMGHEIWQGYLWIAYATNKEDVQVTRIPLEYLEGK